MKTSLRNLFRSTATYVLAASIVMGSVGCAENTSSEGELGESDLTSNTESSDGWISYGETKRITYKRTPYQLYEVLRFDGKAGDKVTVSVRGVAGAQPAVWLLNKDTVLESSNDSPSGTGGEARVSANLTSSGRHFIAVGERSEKEAQFDVSLSTSDKASSAGPGGCSPNKYEFCRCEDLAEGTKRCEPSGEKFGRCECP